jgi:DNA helicase-2/ATP-dependent DNA helicase PcrA
MSAAEIEEERRLMYVAVTRAERYLYITSAQQRRNRPSRRSRFVGELKKALAECT